MMVTGEERGVAAMRFSSSRVGRYVPYVDSVRRFAGREARLNINVNTFTLTSNVPNHSSTFDSPIAAGCIESATSASRPPSTTLPSSLTFSRVPALFSKTKDFIECAQVSIWKPRRAQDEPSTSPAASNNRCTSCSFRMSATTFKISVPLHAGSVLIVCSTSSSSAALLPSCENDPRCYGLRERDGGAPADATARAGDENGSGEALGGACEARLSINRGINARVDLWGGVSLAALGRACSPTVCVNEGERVGSAVRDMLLRVGEGAGRKRAAS